jgi:hypothetical protein
MRSTRVRAPKPDYTPRPKGAHPGTGFAGKYKGTTYSIDALFAEPAARHVRHTPRPPSLNPSQTGSPHAAKPTPNRYTGTECLGIAAMHKSNLVPVFTQDQAVDTAQMRRN